MNHVWAVTFKSPEGKRKILAAGDPVVKGRRCLVIDPANRDVRLKLHWLLFHVPDDEVRVALAPYGKVIEVGTEKWRVQGVVGCGSMTRTAVIRLKPGLGLDDLPHQLRIAGAPALVVAPGRAPLCLRCERTGHIRRDCRVPKCRTCHRFGHDADHCVKTYATATGSGDGAANAEHVMDETDAEEAAKEAVPVTEASKTEADPATSERPLEVADDPPAAVTTVEAGDATTSKEEVMMKDEARSPTEGSSKAHEVQQDNEVHMVDASALATKRPRERYTDSSKDGTDVHPSEPPVKTMPQKKRPVRPLPNTVLDPRGLDKPAG